MFGKVAQYACVLTCLMWSSPSFGASAGGRTEGSATPMTSAPAAATLDASEAAERSKNVLEKAREINEEIYSNLQSFVCNEEIARYKGRLESESGKQIDTVTATVSFENGEERYSDIRQNAHVRPSLSSLAGAWSEGEFGTLLRQTQILLSTKTPNFQMFSDVDGIPALVYAVYVPTEESPWDLEVKSQHYRVPFRTNVWVSEENGDILKIERISTSVPLQAGIAEIRWNVALKEVDLNGRAWLLPNVGQYTVLYQETSHREWNVMHFSNYHRYGSEATIKFQ